MIKVLTLVDCYLPGVRGGGPIRSIANLSRRLGDDLEFWIVTPDHDLGETQPYQGVSPDRWTSVGGANVMYVSRAHLTTRGVARILRETQYDILYLNSFFHRWFTIRPLLLRYMRLIPNRPVVVAPRGEFSPGALALKYVKKRAYIEVVRRSRLYYNVIWQASSTFEEHDIRTWFGAAVRVRQTPIIVAPDLAELPSCEERAGGGKESGRLNLVFISRISRKKNLSFALRVLTDLQGQIAMRIYGPVEDHRYWDECVALIKGLPSNVKVEYCGVLQHDEVPAALQASDLFLFPTMGENFGHVIMEALSYGCPVITTDQTPWRTLEAEGAGWIIPLSEERRYRTVLQQCVDESSSKWMERRAAAHTRAQAVFDDTSSVAANRNLFSFAASFNGRPA